MTPVEILLVRHGAVDAGGRCYGQRHEPDVTDVGRDELSALRARLPLQVARVLRSPARRAAASAALLGHPDATVDDRWAERDLGRFEGRPLAEAWAEAPPEAQVDPAAYAAFTPPGGEPLVAVRSRIDAALDDVVTAGHDTLVVTSGGPVVAAVARALDLDAVVALRLHVATGSVTWLQAWPDGSWTVRCIGG